MASAVLKLARISNVELAITLINHSMASAVLKQIKPPCQNRIFGLINHSMASAVLKPCNALFGRLSQSTHKPFYGFGCIETIVIARKNRFFIPHKPFYGFGCIETRTPCRCPSTLSILINHSMASAVLKREEDVTFGFSFSPS